VGRDGLNAIHQNFSNFLSYFVYPVWWLLPLAAFFVIFTPHHVGYRNELLSNDKKILMQNDWLFYWGYGLLHGWV
jgi:hypothetical protein